MQFIYIETDNSHLPIEKYFKRACIVALKGTYPVANAKGRNENICIPIFQATTNSKLRDRLSLGGFAVSTPSKLVEGFPGERPLNFVSRLQLIDCFLQPQSNALKIKLRINNCEPVKYLCKF